MDANQTEQQIGRALRWIVSILDSHAIPYQTVDGLVARAHGVHRPLVDIDIPLPVEQLAPAVYQCSERQDIDFDASVRVQLYDVEITVMPQDELIRYKRMLEREVDHFAIEQLTDA